jgi:hypothetical protein
MPTKRSAKSANQPRRTLYDQRQLVERLPFPCHGSTELPCVTITSYNLELRSRGSFVGDRASKTAFLERIDAHRASARKRGDDPFGDVATRDLSKKVFEDALRVGDTAMAGVVHAAVEDQAHAMVDVIRRFRRARWRGVEAIVVGGGFREGRTGELVIGRTQSLLDDDGIAITLHPIRRDPDEAGLAGAVHLVPSWMLAGRDAMLAVDVGGNNVRCGVVTYAIKSGRRVRRVDVVDMRHWRYSDDDPSRTAMIDELIAMLRSLVRDAKKRRLKLSPVIGIGCPGRIELDGRIAAGTQNLPGDWEHERFHLPTLVRRGIGTIGGDVPAVVMHNDAVVQGLSEMGHVGKAKLWGVLTIGTGLGNAMFRVRERSAEKKK